VIGGDPVTTGLTASLNRPNSNATGVSFVTAELGGKRVSLISELVPNATTNVAEAIGTMAQPQHSVIEQAAARLEPTTKAQTASSPYRSGRSRDWIKSKNPGAPAVKREAEEDWGKQRWR
jgi:ATP-dependent DNA ligase